MKIAIASDHGGFPLKENLKSYLTERKITFEDFGTHSPEVSVDYPDFACPVASRVSRGEIERGILLCGTGLGMSMVANRYPGVRAALCHDPFSARLSRAHNDSNILVMGGRIIGPELAREILRVWLETPFEGGRHQRRVEKIEKLKTECSADTLICF